MRLILFNAAAREGLVLFLAKSPDSNVQGSSLMTPDSLLVLITEK